jgi:hypothetical protein
MWVLGANGPIRTPSWNQTPYEQSWSFGIEHELPGHILINAEYIGKRGTHLPFSGSVERNFLGPWVESLPVGDFNSAAPCQAGLSIACLSSAVTNPFAGLISDPNSTIGSSFPQIQYYQLLRPFPSFHRRFYRTAVDREFHLPRTAVDRRQEVL